MRRKTLSMTINDSDLTDFKAYLYERENSNATIEKYTTDIRTFYHFLGDSRSINKQCLVAYKEWLAGHYAITSANSMIAALNQFLLFIEAGALKIKRFRVQKQLFAVEEKELSREEYQRLIDTAIVKGKPELALIIETICATGIRISELQYFTVEDVKRGRIQVQNKGKNRIILIPSALKSKLLCFSAKHQRKKGCIFVTRTGKPRNRSNIWAEMKALHQDAGVDAAKIFPHNLRHLFAKVYYAATKDFVGLADLLGHSSLEVTRIYTATASETYQQRVEGLGLVRQ